MASTQTSVAQDEKEEKPEINVWQQALESQIGTQRLNNATLILLGDRDSGKENLSETFVKSEQGDDEKLNTLLLNYRSLTFRDQDNDEEIAQCHLWEVSDTKHIQMLKAVLSNTDVKDISYIIVLDSSKPETTKSAFSKWLKFIEELQGQLMENMSEEEIHNLKERISRHIQFYSDPGDSTANILSEEEKQEIDTDFEKPKNNLGAPIITVVAKCDRFGKDLNEAERVENFDTLLNFVQQWGLDYGAASFTFLENQTVQCRRILSYAVHRTHDVPYKESPSIVVSHTNLDEDYLLNPSGFVNPSLLSSEQEEFDQIFPQSAEQKSAKKRSAKIQAEKDDQVYLKKLKLDIGTVEPIRSTRRSTRDGDDESLKKKPSGSHREHSGSRPPSKKSSFKARPSKNANGRNQEVVQKFFRQLLKADGSSGSSGGDRRQSSRRSEHSGRSSRREGGNREYQRAKNKLENLEGRSSKDKMRSRKSERRT